jgi:hypothetical protein
MKFSKLLDSPLPKLGFYNTALLESDEINKQVQAFLDQWIIRVSAFPCEFKDGIWRMSIDH